MNTNSKDDNDRDNNNSGGGRNNFDTSGSGGSTSSTTTTTILNQEETKKAAGSSLFLKCGSSSGPCSFDNRSTNFVTSSGTSTSHVYDQNVASLAPENDESPCDSVQQLQQKLISSSLETNGHSAGFKISRQFRHNYLYDKPDTRNIVANSSTVLSSKGKDENSYRATVRERNATMLFNECMADVWFVLGAASSIAAPAPQQQQQNCSGAAIQCTTTATSAAAISNNCSSSGKSQQRIPAHAYVLATGSSVFYAMFYGGFSKTEDVAVPDVDQAAFRIMLKYLYTDVVELDMSNVLPTLYVAKKYLVSYLIKSCIRFLEDLLNAQNVCLLLTQSRLFEEEELMQRCWDVIDAQTEIALSSEGFLDIDLNTLESIISRETLSCRETVIYSACLRWADVECSKRRLLEPTPQNKRMVLGRCFDQIRFTTMKVEELADQVAPTGLLDSHELADVFLYHYARCKPDLPFVTRPRVRLPVQRCHRFQTSAFRNNQWHYRGRCDSIQFCTDKRVFVIGFGLYGSSTCSAEYKVCIELKKGVEKLASVNNYLLVTDGKADVFPVYFDQPVLVEPDTFYTASAVLDGDQLSYFGQEGLAEVQTDRVTFQFQCSTESTNGTGVQGGQIPEILFYC